MNDGPVLACGGPIAAKNAPWWLGAWQSNADLIAEVARLGYLDGRVLDATYGRGTFWKNYRPADLWTNDRDLGCANSSHDYRAFPPEWERSFDAVVFDPDYKLNGTPALGDFDARYGIGGTVTREQRYAAILDGAEECYRASRRFVLVKCQDQVESGRQWWMGDDVTSLLCAPRPDDEAFVPAQKVEEFLYLGGGRPQPKDRDRRCPLDTDKDGDCAACRGGGVGYPGCVDGRVPSRQVHAYARPSKLLIFKRPGRST